MISLAKLRAAAEGGGNVLSEEEILALVDAAEMLQEIVDDVAGLGLHPNESDCPACQLRVKAMTILAKFH
jgi:hypothetical protein